MRLSGRKSSSLTRRWTPRQRIALLSLIGANLAAFAVQFILQKYDENFAREFLGLSAHGMREAYSWQFFTAIFLHDGPWDLLGNTLLLYLLGRDVESIVGQRHFILLYFIGALGGEIGHLFLMPADCILFAASGGVAAVIVAYATILPELELTSSVLFALPLRLKAKHLAYGVFVLGILLMIFDRSGAVVHSAYFGGAVAGWLYAHFLGFGRPSFFQRAIHQRHAESDRLRRMSRHQFMTEEIDPLLEKIWRSGISSLTRGERRILSQAREKFSDRTE